MTLSAAWRDRLAKFCSLMHFFCDSGALVEVEPSVTGKRI